LLVVFVLLAATAVVSGLLPDRIGMAGDHDAIAIHDVDSGLFAELPLAERGIQPCDVDAGVNRACHSAGGIDHGITDPDHFVA